MSEPETAILDWQGPVVPAAFAADMDPDAMQEPSVYLCRMAYSEVVTVYVGMTRNFLHRLRDHVAATLGLTYPLRGVAGATVHTPGPVPAYLESIADARRLQELARLEVARMVWHFAPAEPQALPFLEGLLICRVRALEAAGATYDGRRVVSDNGNAGTAPTGPLRVENRGAADAVALLGETVEWPMAAAA